MKKDAIETIEQNLNNYLFEHVPEYHVIRYHNQLRLFIEPISGYRAVAQYINAENRLRMFSVTAPSGQLKKALRVFCLLHDIEFSEGIQTRGPDDD